MKLCIDCRFFTDVGGSFGKEWADCAHPSAVVPAGPPSPVTGEVPRPRRWSCKDNRGTWSNDPCGPEGKYWEAAEPGGFT